MPLAPGTRLGPYEVQASAGSGGMGEVYRARDTRLERSVAIKVLPSRLSSDAERRERMQREARAISSLQHPNICALFDIGSQDGADYLVMEFLEGETLAERLKRGALPLQQALKIGVEIASALDRAHRSGIVHRDLKPGNIMLAKSGAKLMDFGLAKPAALAAAAGGGDTLTAALTTEGAVIGTVPYMAPEQFEDKEADLRSDIFALGAVLYEMVTGRRAFTGKSQASVVANILGRDPEPITATQPLAPPALDALIKVCLAKEPDERWQSAHDVAAQLALIGNASAAERAATSRDKFALVGWVALVVVGLGIMAGVLAWRLWPRTPTTPVARLSITVPAPARLDVDYGERAFAVSPDSQYLAYVALEGSVSHLFLRRFDQFDAMRVANSAGGRAPFFSPDSRSVGFFTNDQLKIAPVDGGPARVVADVHCLGGGAWGEDGTIILSGLTLMRVPATGGRPEPATRTAPRTSGQSGPAVAPAAMGLTEYAPVFLPGAKVVLFTDASGPRVTVRALTLNTGQIRTVIEDGSDAIYSGGYVLYASHGKLWAVRLDPVAAVISGKPMLISDDISLNQFAASPGLLAYVDSTGTGKREPVWTQVGGIPQAITTPAADLVDLALSPDAQRAVASLRGPEQVLQVIDLRTGTSSRLPLPTPANMAPVWTPDGRYVVYAAVRLDSSGGIFRISAAGSGQPELLHDYSEMAFPTSVAVDGTIALMRWDPQVGWCLDMLRPGNPGSSTTFRSGAQQGVFSPDGRWIAYSGGAGSRTEVYVEAYPGPGARYEISSDGTQPQWSRDGRRIYYRSGSKMFVVDVQTRPPFSAGRPVLLFEREFDRGGAVANYAVAPDGRLLMMQSAENNAREIRVLLNWTAALKH